MLWLIYAFSSFIKDRSRAEKALLAFSLLGTAALIVLLALSMLFPHPA